MMKIKKLPLLARAFEDQTIESFYDHAKKLSKPQKPEVKKPAKLRKKKTKDDTNSGLISDSQASRETEAHVGIIEIT